MEWWWWWSSIFKGSLELNPHQETHRRRPLLALGVEDDDADAHRRLKRSCKKAAAEKKDLGSHCCHYFLFPLAPSLSLFPLSTAVSLTFAFVVVCVTILWMLKKSSTYYEYEHYFLLRSLDLFMFRLLLLSSFNQQRYDALRVINSFFFRVTQTCIDSAGTGSIFSSYPTQRPDRQDKLWARTRLFLLLVSSSHCYKGGNTIIIIQRSLVDG